MILKIVSQVFLLSLIAGFGWLYFITLGSPLQEMYLSLATLGLIGLSLLLERLFPQNEEWNKNQDDVTGDIGSFILIFGIIDGALKWLSPLLLLALIPNFGGDLSWPLWVQIIVATLLIEFGAWVSHWAHHRFRSLWALHMMHHSTRRLYTLNNFRFHPLNHIVNYAAAFIPLLALGISTEALLGYTALTMPVLLLQHSNVGFRFGILNYIFNTNTLHRWHHSAATNEGMCNFGRAFVLFDLIFKTFYYPSNWKVPNKIGLQAEGFSYPTANQTLKQILWPFTKECCK